MVEAHYWAQNEEEYHRALGDYYWRLKQPAVRLNQVPVGQDKPWHQLWAPVDAPMDTPVDAPMDTPPVDAPVDCPQHIASAALPAQQHQQHSARLPLLPCQPHPAQQGALWAGSAAPQAARRKRGAAEYGPGADFVTTAGAQQRACVLASGAAAPDEGGARARKQVARVSALPALPSRRGSEEAEGLLLSPPCRAGREQPSPRAPSDWNPQCQDLDRNEL